MNLRLKNLAIALFSIASISVMAACGSEGSDDENASVVNVEKNVAPPMATPEVAGLTNEDSQPSPEIVGADPESEQAVEEAVDQLKTEEATPEGEKRKPAEE